MHDNINNNVGSFVHACVGFSLYVYVCAGQRANSMSFLRCHPSTICSETGSLTGL